MNKANWIEHPAHYNQGIEVIDFIESHSSLRENFHLANVVKYVTRADHKGFPMDDLLKAQWYLNREIKRREIDETK
jgi:hypothetical protein